MIFPGFLLAVVRIKGGCRLYQVPGTERVIGASNLHTCYPFVHPPEHVTGSFSCTRYFRSWHSKTALSSRSCKTRTTRVLDVYNEKCGAITMPINRKIDIRVSQMVCSTFFLHRLTHVPGTVSITAGYLKFY